MSSNQSDLSQSENLSSQDLPPPEAKAAEAFEGFQVTQAIYVAAKLGLAEYLKDGAKSDEQLAIEMGVNIKAFAHLMRLLVHFGIVTVDNNNNYQLTPIGSLLRTDNPDSLLGSVLSLAEIYQAWGNLLHSIQTGKAAFNETFQMSLYEYLDKNTEANAHFNLWMKETSRDWLIPALDAYDFSNIKTFVDVGGHIGALTAEILMRYPNLQAILYDQYRAVSKADKILAAVDVADRCQVVDGDFFKFVPTGGELYLISRVLLNWDDTDALQILKNCRAAMQPPAKLLIMDFVLPNHEESAADLLSSLHSLVLCGRLLRTEDEYYHLLSEAGFQTPKLINTEGPISFIEATPK
jgi:precorrin-6B methylase 2